MGDRASGREAVEPAPEHPPDSFVHSARMLPGLVASAVGYRTRRENARVHRGLPSPWLTFIFSIGDPIELVGERPRHFEVIVSGLHTTPAYVREPVRQEGIQLAVHPLAARRLFGMPAGELVRRDLEGVDLLGRGARIVLDRLGDSSGWQPRFGAVADYARARVDAATRGPGVRPEVAEAWRWLAARHGAGSIRELSRHVALGERQLGAEFTREVGLSPKSVARLMRFDRAVALVAARERAGVPLDLAGIAATCGYFDQSHLARDFVSFTDFSPQRWIAEELRNIQAGGHTNGQS